MAETRQSKGGRARARLLDPERRSQIASDAAKKRWSGEGTKARLESNKNRVHLHVGASRIRDIILGLSEAERPAFIQTIWPDLPQRIARLVARYPGETRVSGSQLKLPQSWMDETLGTTHVSDQWHPGDE